MKQSILEVIEKHEIDKKKQKELEDFFKSIEMFSSSSILSGLSNKIASGSSFVSLFTSNSHFFLLLFIPGFSETITLVKTKKDRVFGCFYPNNWSGDGNFKNIWIIPAFQSILSFVMTALGKQMLFSVILPTVLRLDNKSSCNERVLQILF